MIVSSHNYAQKRRFYASFTDDILYFQINYNSPR